MNDERFSSKIARQLLAGEITPQEAERLLALAIKELEAELRRVEQIRKEKTNV